MSSVVAPADEDLEARVPLLKCKKRNLIERCFNKLNQFRHIASRYDRSA